MRTVNGSATVRTRVKICGITTLGDALGAVDTGADALGFVFARSPRRVTPEQAREIITGAVPPFVTPVGVFVDETPAAVAAIAREAGLQAAQLHGAETPEYIRELRAFCPGVRLIKALRIRSEEDVRAVHAFRECCDAALLDAYVPGVAGGTGQTFNWELARVARVYELPIILAGGLTPENAADAVRAAGPYAVDVSTGVESSPGRKDPEKVRAFLEAVRGAM